MDVVLYYLRNMFPFLLKLICGDSWWAVNMFQYPFWQGNKLTKIPEKMMTSCTMLTEINACNNQIVLSNPSLCFDDL